MSAIEDLQSWYLSQCNEDWEHTYGVEIGTIDNPGWSLKVELTDTEIDGKPYAEFSYGIGGEAEQSGNNWLITKVENNSLGGYGGPEKLEELINKFLAWAKTNT